MLGKIQAEVEIECRQMCTPAGNGVLAKCTGPCSSRRWLGEPQGGASSDGAAGMARMARAGQPPFDVGHATACDEFHFGLQRVYLSTHEYLDKLYLSGGDIRTILQTCTSAYAGRCWQAKRLAWPRCRSKPWRSSNVPKWSSSFVRLLGHHGL